MILLGRLDGEVGNAGVVGAAVLLDGDGVGGHLLELAEDGAEVAPASLVAARGRTLLTQEGVADLIEKAASLNISTLT
jgi:hypothetical protein